MIINKSHDYFSSRTQAGAILAEYAQKYRYEDTIILTMSKGGVLVGAEMARHLHALIAMLLTKDIYLPDGRTIIGIINEKGGFVYNNAFSAGAIEEFVQEYRNHIEQAKIEALHDMHMALGQGGEISPDYFKDRDVIVVTDGAMSATAFDAAYDFLKPIRYKKLIIATPVATVEAIDKMHIMADDLIVLSAKANPLEVDHYYDDNKLPDNKATITLLNNIILEWKSVEQANANAHNLGTKV